MDQSSNRELSVVIFGSDDKTVDVDETHQQIYMKEPCVGMAFKSYEDVHHFYKEYGKHKGFGVMVKHSNKRSDGRCRRLVLCCCKAGKGPDEPSRPSGKTDCRAKIIAKLWEDGMLHLVEVDNEHNHLVSPSEPSSIRFNEKLPSVMKKRRKISYEDGVHPVNSYQPFVVHGHENLSFGHKGREIVQEVLVAKPLIKVTAICGSLRRASVNQGLLRAAIQLCNESISGMQIEYVDISALPFLNTDLEVNGMYPQPVEVFRRKILGADSILFASPEYNYSFTGPLKNAIDWASRPPNVWAKKPAAIVSAGGGFGGGRSQYHLRQVGVFLDLHFVNKPELLVKAFDPPQKFDSNGNLIDPETKEKLMQLLLSLRDLTYRLQSKTPCM